MERGRGHGSRVCQRRCGELRGRHVPHPGEVAAGHHDVPTVATEAEEPNPARERDPHQAFAPGKTGHDRVIIGESRRHHAAIRAPCRGRGFERSAGEGDRPLVVEVPQQVANVQVGQVGQVTRDEEMAVGVEDQLAARTHRRDNCAKRPESEASPRLRTRGAGLPARGSDMARRAAPANHKAARALSPWPPA